jgi:transposase
MGQLICGGEMGAAVKLRDDYPAEILRQFAKRSKDAGQARRLLALAGVQDGVNRRNAARIGGMDRQTLRDWVHAFNAHGPDGLVNSKAPGAKPKLDEEQMAELARIVEAGPNIETDGVVRWRCIDLKQVIKSRFAVDVDEVTVGRLLKKLDYAHISARPRHPEQDAEVLEAFKKTSPRVWTKR